MWSDARIDDVVAFFEPAWCPLALALAPADSAKPVQLLDFLLVVAVVLRDEPVSELFAEGPGGRNADADESDGHLGCGPYYEAHGILFRDRADVSKRSGSNL